MIFAIFAAIFILIITFGLCYVNLDPYHFINLQHQKSNSFPFESEYVLFLLIYLLDDLAVTESLFFSMSPANILTTTPDVTLMSGDLKKVCNELRVVAHRTLSL